MASATKRISLGIEELFELLHLGHELFVDMEAAGGVDDERVAGRCCAASRRASLARRSTSFGAGGLVVDFAFVETGLDGLGDDFELLARGGTVDVDRDEHGAVAAFF